MERARSPFSAELASCSPGRCATLAAGLIAMLFIVAPPSSAAAHEVWLGAFTAVMLRSSSAGAKFVADFEGFVSKAYLCPAGVVTIGYGFTMGSTVFAMWWLAKYGRPLALGDTISRADADMLLPKIIDEEYGAAVNAKIKPRTQHHYDGAASPVFNCGVGAASWRWAQALARGDVAEAARLLRVTAVTANGYRLDGLVRRRGAEARLIETGDYGFVLAPLAPPSVSTRVEDVTWYQERLARLGYALDVTGDPNAPDSDAAVRDFQRNHALLVDGIVGAATRATIIRALDGKAQTKASAGGGAAGGAATGGAETLNAPPAATPPIDANGMPIEPGIIDPAIWSALAWGLGGALAVAAIVALGYLAWRYRGRLTGRRAPT